MRKLLLSTLAVLSLSAPLAGVAQAQWGHPPPPGLRYEATPAWRPGFVWRPGYWNWAGGSYVWVGGAYVPHAPGYGHWVPGHWTPRGWRPAHWVP
jgi:hypothetical protein